jgi:hypothetical protein
MIGYYKNGKKIVDTQHTIVFSLLANHFQPLRLSPRARCCVATARCARNDSCSYAPRVFIIRSFLLTSTPYISASSQKKLSRGTRYVNSWCHQCQPLAFTHFSFITFISVTSKRISLQSRKECSALHIRTHRKGESLSSSLSAFYSNAPLI